MQYILLLVIISVYALRIVKQNNESMVRLLLEHGADVNAVIMDSVAHYEHIEMFDAMRRASASMQRLGNEGAEAQCQELDLAAPAEACDADIMWGALAAVWMIFMFWF